MCLGVPGETTKPFLEDGDINAPDKLMPVVDVENQYTGARTAWLLSPSGVLR